MASQPIELTIVLKGDGSGLTGTVRLSAEEVKKLGEQMDQAGAKGRRMGQDMSDSAALTARSVGVAVKAVDMLVDTAGKLAGAMVNSVKNAIDMADATGKMASRVNLSVEALSSLQHAARSNGEDLGAIPRLLDAIGTSSAKAAGGSRQHAADFRAMGISLRDANGQMKPTSDLLTEVAARLNEYRDGTAKTALSQRLFGESGASLTRTLKQLGEEGFDGLQEKAAAAGRLISEDTAAKAAKFNDEMQRVQDRVSGTAMEIGVALLPSLTSAAEGFADFISAALESESVRSFFAGLWELIESGVGIIRDVASELFAFASDPTFLQFLEATKRELELIKSLLPEGMKGMQAGAPLTISWSEPDWYRRISTTPETRRKMAINDGMDAARNNPWASMDSNTVLAAAKPLLDDLSAKWKALTGDVDAFGTTLKATGMNVTDSDAPLPKIGKQALDTGAAIRAQAAAMDSLSGFADQLAGKLGGPLDAAMAQYNANLARADQLAQSALIHGKDQDAVFAAHSRAYANANALLDQQIGKIAEATDAEGAMVAKLNAEIAARGKGAIALKAEQLARQAIAAEQKAGIEMTEEERKAREASAADRFREQLVMLDQVQKLHGVMDDFGEVDGFKKIREQINQVKEALHSMRDAAGNALDEKQVEKLQRALGGLQRVAMSYATDALGQGITSLKSMATEGSKAYAALEVAQTALNLATAIGAIANQGMGDPYTAFARIAAMAAMMAQLVDGIGGLVGGGGPSSASAEVRQANQGTGTVLGDSTAKSESILRATEITAHATEQLVGINRGMLSALQALQRALGAAGGLLARGAGDVEFSGLHNARYGLMGSAGRLDPLMNSMTGGYDPLGNAIGSFLWGGKQKVIDQGILIAGGAITDMIEQVMVGAYRTVKTSGGLFGSDKTSDQMMDISDSFGRQFQLVIQSIAETVRQGALALGLLPADVEAALAAFRVEEIRISLKGLSAEEQQAEIEAVFSSIFDNLAGSVVPFVEQFQKVGEGLGETLVRIATEVQVAREAFRQLGLAVDVTDPERIAQISDALIEASGGLDAFISSMQSFVANFAPESHQFRVASEALASAFDQVGLTVPATREEMWALMQSLDATTESGREQIATLLRLSDVADRYYDSLEKSATSIADYIAFIGGLNNQGAGASTVSPFIAERRAIEKWEQDSIKRANDLARSIGLQGASSKDLALISEIAAHRVAEALAALEEQSREIIYRLRHNGASLKSEADAASSAVTSFGGAMTRAARDATNAIDLLIGDKSPFGDDRKLEIARGGLMAGTVTQDQFLEIARRLFGTTDRYAQEFRFAQQFPGRGTDAYGGGYSGNYASTTSSAAEYTAADRRADAQTLAQNIVSIANAQNESYADVTERLDYSLAELSDAMGLGDEELIAYLDNLKAQENAVPNAIVDGANRIVDAIYDVNDRLPPNLVDIQNGPDVRRGDMPASPTPPLPGRQRGGADGGAAGGSAGLSDQLEAMLGSLRELRAAIDRTGGETVDAINDGADATRDVRRAVVESPLPAMHDRR